MQNRIHIFGASGSGTTTLGKALSEELKTKHFDTDDFYWIKSDPPFQNPVPKNERQQKLDSQLKKYENWVLSGSLCGWGDFAIPYFTLAIYLYIPNKIRMERLRKREIERYGSDILKQGHPMRQTHLDFISWANNYDEGGMEMRSKLRHYEWIKTMPLKVISIVEEMAISDLVNRILNEIHESRQARQ